MYINYVFKGAKIILSLAIQVVYMFGWWMWLCDKCFDNEHQQQQQQNTSDEKQNSNILRQHWYINIYISVTYLYYACMQSSFGFTILLIIQHIYVL